MVVSSVSRSFLQSSLFLCSKSAHISSSSFFLKGNRRLIPYFTCYPFRHGKEVQNWTTKQARPTLRCTHSALWKTRSFRPISTRIRKYCPRSPNSWNDFYSRTRQTWTKFSPPKSRAGCKPRRLPKWLGPVAFWPPCQESRHTMGPGPGPTSCASRNLSFAFVVWLDGARGSLWQKPRPSPKRIREPGPDDHATDPHDEVSDFQGRDDRAAILAKESQLSKACSAPLPVRKCRIIRHVGQRMGPDGSLPVASTSSLTLVQEAIHSLAPRQQRRGSAHNTSIVASSRGAQTSWCDLSVPWSTSWPKAAFLAPWSPGLPVPR